MIRRSALGVILITVILMSDVGPAYSQSPAKGLIRLELVAPQKKRDGRDWDSEIPVILPILGSPMPLIGKPSPDMRVYILDQTGGKTLLTGGTGAPKTNAAAKDPCDDSFLCTFSGAAVPQDYFGVVVLDQDLESHDFMLAAIIRVQDEEDAKIEQGIEDRIHAFLKTTRVIQGVPASGSELPVVSLDDCLGKGCFGDSLAATPLLKVSTTIPDDGAKNKKCAMTMTAEISAQPVTARDVLFNLNFTENACRARGQTIVSWDFGDGTTQRQVSTDGTTHTYSQSGTFPVSAIPQCVREITVCDAPAVQGAVNVEK